MNVLWIIGIPKLPADESTPHEFGCEEFQALRQQQENQNIDFHKI